MDTGKSRRKSALLLRSRIVLPISSPPIENGAVLIRGGKIRAVGHWRELARLGSRRTVDLGDSILMPGLVNAHCHLDYTQMAGMLPPPKRFTDWLQLIVSVKAHWSLADYRKSWQEGVQMLLRRGTTTVADIEAFPELLPECWEETPLRVISFIEMISISGRREPEAIVRDAVERIQTLRHTRCRAGLSPHAPYSTQPDLMRLSAETARDRHWLLCSHVSESRQEFEMFVKGKGELFDWLRRSGRDMSDCGGISPVQYMERCNALGRDTLVVHANYLRRGDAELLARRDASVVHCPRSHAYFGHDPFPFARLRRAGVNLCLGTDSLATVFKRRREVVELSMFEEMREFASRTEGPSARMVVKMATVNGARALGISGKAGELTKGAQADLIAIPFAGKRSEAYEAVVHHNGPVAASMIGGEWIAEKN